MVEKRRLPINVIEEAYTETKKTPITKTVKFEEKDSKITPVPITQKERIVATEKTKIPPPSSQNKVDTPTVAKPVVVSTPKVQPVKFTCPRTNFEFERDWKTYKGRGDDILYQYFQVFGANKENHIYKPVTQLFVICL